MIKYEFIVSKTQFNNGWRNNNNFDGIKKRANNNSNNNKKSKFDLIWCDLFQPHGA